VENIYVVHYSGQSTPKAKDPIAINAGKMKCVAVPFPSQGFVTKLIVVQSGGPAVGVAVELLDSKIPFPVGEYATGTAPLDELAHYQILKSQNASAGNFVAVRGEEAGFPFVNRDSTFTDNQRFVYLVISPIGAVSATQWDATIICHRDSG
jgi:hypothetical protein